MANPLRQGIHDQAAGSLVVQRAGVTSNAAVVGCLLVVALFILLPIISIIALIALGSQVEDILREVGQSI
jgi:phosphohistidine swiveling domain-containing protein